MKNKDRTGSALTAMIAACIFILILAIFGKSVQAAGLLKPVNGNQSTISITSHDVRVVINNGYARTEVDQVFLNSGESDLEAIYSFPLPREASLSELSLWIDGQEVVGEVLEKQRANEIYQEQKSQGNQTAIAEKDDYKTFDVSVSPVKANDHTRVRLVYYQPLTIDLNIGRYVYPLAEGGVDEEKIAFWSVDSDVEESFSFDLILKSAQPVKDLRMPGYTDHAVIEMIQNGENEAGGGEAYHAKLDFNEGATLTQDIIFYYRLDDSVPGRVELIPYKEVGNPTGTIMLIITPGASLQKIAEGVDWVFVLDKSGSMSGNKIATLKDGVSRVIGKMSPQDRFRIVTFNDSAEDFTKGFISATPENVNNVLNSMSTIIAGGGTALHAGLELGLNKTDNERTSSIVVVTDGVANIGPTQRGDFLKLIDERDVRLFTFVIGNSANRPLLDKLAKASGGLSMDISASDDIYGKILQAKNKLLYEALHDVEVTFSGTTITKLSPKDIGSLYRGQQLIMFGRYEAEGPLEITLSAKISGERQEWKTTTVLPQQDTDNPEIERLWALSSIEEVMEDIRDNGENAALRDKVVQLGTEYSLVTDYTSMLVLNEQEMEGLGIQRSNANRVYKERQAQQQKQQQKATSYRVDTAPENSMFGNSPSPGVGSGPVGPLFLLLFAACRRIKRISRK